MNASLLNQYRQLHLTLSGELDRGASTALTPLDRRLGLLPILPPVVQMVQEGWAHDEVPLMMNEVMRNVHEAITTIPPREPVWTGAVKSFNEMIKIAVETLKPVRGNGLHITNNVMLESLREVRI